jgi:hypothetical protein
VDCWENKPPGIAWLSALGLVIQAEESLGAWLIPPMVAILNLAIFSWIVYRGWGVFAAMTGGLLAGIVTTMRMYDAPSINPDFYGSMFALGGSSMIVAALGWREREANTTASGIRFATVLLSWLAGLWFCAAVLVKQTGLVALICFTLVGVFGHLFARRSGKRIWLTGGVWFAAVLGLGVAAFVLASQDLLRPAWEAIFTFNRGLMSPGHLGASLWTWERAAGALCSLQFPLWLAGIGVLAAAWPRSNEENGPILLAAALFLWWLCEVVLALAGPSQSMRYWQGTFPPMLWLAALGLHRLREVLLLLLGLHRAVAFVLVVTAAYFLGHPLWDSYRHGLASSYLAYAEGDSERARLREIGAVIQEHVPAGERIYVLAYDAGVYVYADRLPASRFTYPRSKEQMDEILADLSSAKAYAIVVPSRVSGGFEKWCDDECHKRIDEITSSHATATGSIQYSIRLKGK